MTMNTHRQWEAAMTDTARLWGCRNPTGMDWQTCGGFCAATGRCVAPPAAAKPESGAHLMRNRCAFTSRDMTANAFDAFVFAIVLGWDGDDVTESAMAEVAEKHGWDAELVAFLRDAHQRFSQLPRHVVTRNEL